MNEPDEPVAPAKTTLQILLPDNEGFLLLSIRGEAAVCELPGHLLREGLEYSHGFFCGGSMRFSTISEAKHVLSCLKCGLRLDIPASVTNWNELNNHMVGNGRMPPFP